MLLLDASKAKLRGLMEEGLSPAWEASLSYTVFCTVYRYINT